jgi:hypothetical protein
MSDRDAERNWVEPIVERVVDKVFQTQLVQLRSEITRRVSEEIAAQPSSAYSSTSADLARALVEIQLGTSQKEILRALLDTCARYAPRVALFVVKGSTATGWQARGFATNEALKDFALDAGSAAVLRALTDRVSTRAADGEFDPRFIEQFGTASNVRVLPLILKDKVAALLYADGGVEDRPLDTGALDVLVLATGSWLEVNSLRKQAAKDPSAHADAHAEPHEVPAKPPVPVSSAPALNDPFAAHAPSFAMAAAAPASSQVIPHTAAQASAHSFASEVSSVAVAEPPAIESVAVEPLALGNVHTAGAPEPTVTFPTSPAMSPEDEELHRKAKRFARLLVDEIKLYNKSKLAEGRAARNLYDLLKDPIDKSRATYQKRYGSTVAASGNYFEDEMKRSLAEDDLNVMGPNFQVGANFQA